MTLLRSTPADLFALIGETSDTLGLPIEFVEKDYWITELLRSVASPVEDALVIFKGGTSLSKGFGIIQRFSEDVDILLVPDPKLGKGTVDKTLKHICARAGEALGLGDSDQGHEGATTGIRRAIRYEYPAQVDASIVRSGVLLEMGVRGGPEPHERRRIRSFIAQHAIESRGLTESEYDEFAPFDVDILKPERTLFEKLSLLHHLGSTFPESEERLRTSGRHIYDVGRLLRHERTVTTLQETPNLAADLSRDIDEYSTRFGWGSTPRPAVGYASSPVFDPESPCAEPVKAAYETATNLVYGEVPLLEDCRSAVQEHAALL